MDCIQWLTLHHLNSNITIFFNSKQFARRFIHQHSLLNFLQISLQALLSSKQFDLQATPWGECQPFALQFCSTQVLFLSLVWLLGWNGTSCWCLVFWWKLSQRTWVAATCSSPKSYSTNLNHLAWEVASAILTNLDSAVERATMFCLIEAQENTSEPRLKAYPEVLLTSSSLPPNHYHNTYE